MAGHITTLFSESSRKLATGMNGFPISKLRTEKFAVGKLAKNNFLVAEGSSTSWIFLRNMQKI
jgi:hypothetical protein